MNFEQVIFNNLVNSEEYTRKTLPFLKEEYFTNSSDRIIFNLCRNYIDEYEVSPNKQALAIDLDHIEKISEDTYAECSKIIDNIPATPEKENLQWLLDKTEEFCKSKAIYNAVHQTIKIIDGQDKSLAPGAIPQLLQDALAVSFDTSIGHDFFDDAEARFDFYNNEEERLPFDLESFNKITKGGLPKKTLTIAMADTGVGKSLFMCHCASAALACGFNVLYITLEMSEERITERIDANILDVPIDELNSMPKERYLKRIGAFRRKTPGTLVVKEYPTTSASTLNFRYLLNELRIKKNFKPDIIFIDYMNICASARIKNSSNVNSYSYIKAIAEEIRGLAVEFNVPIMTATQSNRAGHSNSDIDLTNTSESYGSPMTADLMFGIVQTEELKAISQFLIIQLKNRYSDMAAMKRFVIGVDKSKMKLYNLEANAQDNIMNDTQTHGNNNKFKDFS